jgi:hypothetical protein
MLHCFLYTRSLIVLLTFHLAEIGRLRPAVLSLVVEVLCVGDNWYRRDSVRGRFKACQGNFNDDQVLRDSLVSRRTRLGTVITQRSNEKHTKMAGSAMNNLSETFWNRAHLSTVHLEDIISQ